jgi:hypothetical protein
VDFPEHLEREVIAVDLPELDHTYHDSGELRQSSRHDAR